MSTRITSTLNKRGTFSFSAVAAFLMLVSGAAPVPTWAAPPTLQQSAALVAPDGVRGDAFGSAVAVAIEGQTAIVGAPGKTVRGTGQSGAVYLYTRSSAGGWTKRTEIRDPHAGRSHGTGSEFGAAVALSADGEVALVGAPGACDPATCTNTQSGQEGAVYVYTRRSSGTWTRTAVLSDPQRTYRDRFGQTVGLSADGRRALVGAPGAQAQNGPAAAYFYKQAGGHWTLNGQASTPTPQADKMMSFASSVALSSDGTLAIIGARHEDGSAPNQGAAYIWHYHKGVWRRTGTLHASDAARDLEFGYAVAVERTAEGPVALVGSPGVQEPCPCSNPTNSAGAVYVFASRGGVWTQTAELSDPAHTSWDSFGSVVALTPDGHEALISAATTYWWAAPVATGRAYLFAYGGGTWSLAQQFLNPNQGERDFYGSALALDGAGATVFIGAGGYPGDTASNANQGAVYVSQ